MTMIEKLTKTPAFTIEKCSNMILITDATGGIWEAWDQTEITERKLANAINRIRKRYIGPVEFIRKIPEITKAG